MDIKSTSAAPAASDSCTLSAEELLSRARRAKAASAVKRGVAASAVMLAGAQGLHCASDESASATSNVDEVTVPNVPKPGADNNGQVQGQRRPDMVSYKGDFWTEDSNCNTRAGCMDLDFIMKVFVQRVDNANLDKKRVGVMFRVPSWQAGRSEMALGQYFATNGNTEEWHVRIRLHPWMDSPQALLFDAWYEDGLGNTYYDDNEGEFHVATKGSYGIIRQMWCCEAEANDIHVNGQGVSGQIGLILSDLAYNKDVELIWTTDHWVHTNTFGMGGAATDDWQWVRDSYSGYEVWHMALDIPATNPTAFEYAAVYKHGVVNGAKTYEFWDNNGGNNYVVTP